MLAGAWACTGDVYVGCAAVQSHQRLHQLFGACGGGYICGCALVVCMCILVCTLLISSRPPSRGSCRPAVQRSHSVRGHRKDVQAHIGFSIVLGRGS